MTETIAQPSVAAKKRRYLRFNTSVTLTSAFLLPTIDIPYGVIKNYGFVNAYIGDRRKETMYPTHCLFLLFNYKNLEDIEIVGDLIRESQFYVDEYDPSENHVVFVVRVPEHRRRIYDLFLEGQYSEFDTDYIEQNYPKKIFAGVDAYNNPLSKDSLNYLVLTRDPGLKKEIEDDLGVELKDRYVNGKWYKYQLMSKPDLISETL